ncbi:MAG: penicillin-binding transpeptidase domain-containing protein [Candidatus Sericytochromatia bacterium]
MSVVVADTQTGKVETYIGSQDFFDIENKGQVNGVIAPRSTGSILKPFLYALSIDDGLLLPDTKIKDIPTYFGAFSPENSDKKYNGLISMKEALVRSLNIPAVLTLNEYGVYDFYSFLKKAGLSTLFRNSDEYGLTLILGGAEANLFEITSLYSSLGRLGKFTNLKIIPSEQNQEEKQLISEGASNLILNVLKDLKRPDAEYYWQQYENQFKLAWKTGTSFGNRDAWAVGVNPKWTVGVWVGNFTGETNANLAGATSAGSLMFDIFNYLPQKSKQKWFKNEFNNFEMTEICQDTGYKAGSSCTKKLIVEKPIAAKNIKICPYHKTIFVNNDEKYQVCSLCWNKDDLKKKNFLIYTPDTIDYLRKRGNIINNIPVHNPSCKSIQSKNLLKIIYPTNNSKILLPKDIGGVLQKINIKVAHLNENIKVYWYIDEKFLGQTQATHSKAIELKSGFHKISVIDENGNQDSCSIQIF